MNERAALTTIGVVGTGIMGRGIMQLFALAGFTVRYFDQNAEALTAAQDFVTSMIDRQVTKGRLETADADAAKKRLVPCERLEDLAPCDAIVEAIVERTEVKQSLFAELEAVVPETTILATNTSSLMVAEIAQPLAHPERVAGLHFFNPVPLMRVVEVIAAVRTEAHVVERLAGAVSKTGHRAVVTVDQPGFLVNHAGRGLLTEGLRVLEERVADVEAIDTLMREAGGFRMGPFELLDLTGLDVSGKVLTSIYEQFFQEPRYRPSSLVAPRVAAELFGRKTGEGWYRYDDDGHKITGATPGTPAVNLESVAVWIDPSAHERDALVALASAAGAGVVDDAGEATLCVVQPWGHDASSTAIALGLDPERTVAVDPLPGLDRHRTIMITPVTTRGSRDAAHALFAADGTNVTIVSDSPGFVVQRIVAAIVNTASEIAGRGIANPADIDAAVKLGLGYPEGPLEMGDGIGADRIVTILEHQLEVTGDPRYRPSQWLRRRAMLGLPLTAAGTPRSG